MEEKLKIQRHFGRLRTEIGYSLEKIPELQRELSLRLSAFENITAPEKKIYPWEEKYWMAKTVLMVDFIENSFPGKERYGEELLASCGYDNNEIERIIVIREGKLERRVLRPQDK